MQLRDYFMKVVRRCCAVAGAKTLEVLDPGRKHGPITEARKAIVVEMRRTVGRFSTMGGYRIWEAGKPDNAIPISYPKLGVYMRLTHSALVPRKKKK